MQVKTNIMLQNILVWFYVSAIYLAESGRTGKLTNHSTNILYLSENLNLNGIASSFSPRIDFDQWKPLTGRGDPLRNDPTYDYEPPVLERVHYWADEIHSQREKYPEKKSEVLVLGVSSRKPSGNLRPQVPIRRLPQSPVFASKYEDFSYKFSDHYPMTILVPPPPPPPIHSPSHYFEDNLLLHTTPIKFLDTTMVIISTTPTTPTTPKLLTSFALQESNLIFQSSSTKQNWSFNNNKTTNLPNNTVSSDYAGWGPTTPLEDTNEAYNIIPYSDNYKKEFTSQPLSYYKPVLSEAPPPPQVPSNSIEVPSFLPTISPPTLLTVSTTQRSTETMQKTSTELSEDNRETSSENLKYQPFQISQGSLSKTKPNIIEMLGSMVSMPLIPDPERQEDNLYAHASDAIQIYKSPPTEESVNLEVMQTMQPPPPVKLAESSTVAPRQSFHLNSHILNNMHQEKSTFHTHDPYLHMRFTTPTPLTSEKTQNIKSTTEGASMPSYLIIQGHSKVKTYGSKPKLDNDAFRNEISNPNETNQVKHLHPIKDKDIKKSDKKRTNRESKAQNLKSLLDIGFGSIEFQETDVGIKYDVSDGSEVPVEIYKKGIIVDSYENNYSNKKDGKRSKRQTNLSKVFKLNNDSYGNIVFDVPT